MRAAGVLQGDAHLPVDTDKIVGGSKLLGQMRDLIRRKHYSIRTEQAYLEWTKRYILFHGKSHPGELGEAQIVAFLNHLAVDRKVAASTQNQALNALVFLYRQVLGREELALDGIDRAKRPERLPMIFDRGGDSRGQTTVLYKNHVPREYRGLSRILHPPSQFFGPCQGSLT